MAIIAKPTQDFVPIKAIRDGVLIMKDGFYSSVLMISSINFALKSEEEQDAIIFQFQNFLNSLDFSMQIFIQSRKLDIGPYLNRLRDAEKKQTNELLRIQTREYIEFVKNFVKSTEIVTKTFFAVVPFKPEGMETIRKKGGIGGIFSSKLFKPKKNEAREEGDDKFDEYKIQLQQRMDVVSQGLVRCGLKVAPLNTEEIIELFYKLFNPGELERESTETSITSLLKKK